MRFIILVLSGWLLLLRTLRAHLAVINDGSPTPETALHIADVTLAQAFYGRLDDGGTAYYRFEAASGTELRLSMLIPLRYYNAGFRITLLLSGPGFPQPATTMPSSDEGMRIGTTSYQRTQRATFQAAGGSYVVAIHAAGAGVYCFCLGTREPDTYADASTRAQVLALLEG